MARMASSIQKTQLCAPNTVDDPAPGRRDRAPIALVVDDEPLVRRFVSTVLRRQGWLVREAADAVGALSLATEPFDLLVTDYEMPGISGLALAAQLRLRDENLPVLMVSGYPEAAGEIRHLKGRIGFARKPFEAKELVASICSILS
jgi:DNA-binding response OmpR family regulator